MAIHSNILAWRIPWTEDPGGLQSVGLQKSQKQLSHYAHTTKKSINNHLMCHLGLACSAASDRKP